MLTTMSWTHCLISPLATWPYQTDKYITLRGRDNTDEIYDTEEEVVRAVKGMVDGMEMWKDIVE